MSRAEWTTRRVAAYVRSPRFFAHLKHIYSLPTAWDAEGPYKYAPPTFPVINAPIEIRSTGTSIDNTQVPVWVELAASKRL